MQLLPILAASILANNVKLKKCSISKRYFYNVRLTKIYWIKSKIKKKKKLIELKK